MCKANVGMSEIAVALLVYLGSGVSCSQAVSADLATAQQRSISSRLDLSGAVLSAYTDRERELRLYPKYAFAGPGRTLIPRQTGQQNC